VGWLGDARACFDRCWPAYNHPHRHAVVRMQTPASVHYGTATDIRARRQATLDRAHAQHPERFTHRPHLPCLPEQAWINQPTQQQPTQ